MKKDKDAVMVVLPSDHFINQESIFVETVNQAVEIAERRRGLITIGIKPTRPETGYGYIQMGNRVRGNIPTFKVTRFTEKPNLEIAKDFLIDGNYLWNSGMFIWRADVYLREMQKYLPEMYNCLMEVYKTIGTEEEEKTTSRQYELIEGISVDFGIMQKTRKAYVIKSEFQWDDIGSFSAMSRFADNYRGNSIKGKTFLEQSENCFVMGKEKLIIGFGIKDLIIVDSGDVLLVMDKNRDQEIKHLVNLLKEKHKYDEYL